jgi:4,5-DOPA dioxygenase extradiol
MLDYSAISFITQSRLSMSNAMPTLFVPHGAPTFALRPGAAGTALANIAKKLPAPRAIIIISPHWDTAVPTVGSSAQPETVHDFGGFPEELYRIQYPATGCPEGAQEVMQAIQAAGLPAELAPRQGLDHGAWVPLRLMFPEADVPVIPLSLQSRAGPQQAYRLGQALAGLGEKGFLVIGSGNLTHNLQDYFVASRNDGQTPSYVRDFAEWIADRVENQGIEELLNYRVTAPSATRAHPTDEHLLPLYVAWGAAGADAKAERFYSGIDDYVLAMDAYTFTPQHAA